MKQNLLTKVMLLLVMMLVGTSSAWAQSDFSATYTSNVTLTAGTNGSACTVDGEDGVKVGTSSKGGDCSVQVPAGTKYLHLHVAAWKGVNGLSLNISGATVSPTSISLTADEGISNSTPFTFSGDPSTTSYYKVVELTTVPNEATTVKFTTSTTKRFVMWGVNAEIMPSSISLDKTTLDVAYGDDDETLTATVLPSSATNKSVTWTTTNAAVATVSNGVVSFNGPGVATITAKTANNLTATCNVNVAASSSPSVVLSTMELNYGEVEVGQNKPLTFTITPANLTGDLAIGCNNDKYRVSPASINQGETTAQTITVTASPTALNDDMDGTITISGGGITPKEVTLSATPYQVANVTLVATDGNIIKQGGVEVTSIASRVGSTATIVAVPVDGFTFYGWTAVGATPASSPNAEEVFTFTSATPTLTASFVRNGVEPVGPGEGSFTLVTDASTLNANDELLIASSKEDGDFYAMSAIQKTNNRDGVDVTISGQAIASISNSQVITLEGTTDAWYLNVGDNAYLYAASSDANQMKTDTKGTVGNNGKAKISIDNTSYAATIQFQGTNTRNLIRYNSGSQLFSCYGSGQENIYLYRKNVVTSFDVSIGATGWRTLVSSENVSLPNGVKAYIVTDTDGGVATLTEVTSVKANTPVLLNGDAGTYTLSVIDTPYEPTGNLLKISKSNVSDNGCYVLSERNSEVGFYLWEGGSLGAGRVILPASAVTEVREFIGFGNIETGVASLNAEGQTKANAIYDLSGRRVAKTTQGIYIVNGKKMIVK